jgi:hypothetical protein
MKTNTKKNTGFVTVLFVPCVSRVFPRCLPSRWKPRRRRRGPRRRRHGRPPQKTTNTKKQHTNTYKQLTQNRTKTIKRNTKRKENFSKAILVILNRRSKSYLSDSQWKDLSLLMCLREVIQLIMIDQHFIRLIKAFILSLELLIRFGIMMWKEHKRHTKTTLKLVSTKITKIFQGR